MREKIVKLYKFDELSDKAKEKAIENLRDINTDYEWWDCEFEDTKTIGELMGITIDNIYFSGFASQGDGACFEGSYEFKRNSIKAVKDYAPTDKELHRIAKDLQTIQRRYFYQLSANVKHQGHYYHENCTMIDVGHNDCYSYRLPDGAEDIQEPLRDFMRWIYRQLEKQYEYLVTDEAIIETIQANEYEFTEDGKLDH